MRKLLTMMLCGMTILSLVACSKTLSEDKVRGEQIINEASAEKESSDSNEHVSITEAEETEAVTEGESFSMGKSEGLFMKMHLSVLVILLKMAGLSIPMNRLSN